VKIKLKKIRKSVEFPKYEKLAAGFDFKCVSSVIIEPKEQKMIPTNLAMKIPEGYVLLLVPRSSTPARFGLSMPHSIGVIDPFWNGDENEILLLLYNFTDKPVTLKKGDRIAQGIIVKYEKADFVEVSSLGRSNRKKYKEVKPRSK
jgi:dUTP pyrophosphatase